MWIQRLHLQNFRIYQNATFSFSPGANILTGPNASGKTTVLEALYLLITGRSFRTRTLQDLLRAGAPFFSVEAEFVREGVVQLLQFLWDGQQRTCLHNRTKQTNLFALFGLLQGVVLTPADDQLIKGAPQQRRQFLDIQLVQSDPLYLHHLSRYYRALKQRNRLLKMDSMAGMDAWEEQLSLSAAYISRQRQQIKKEIEEEAAKIYPLLGGKEDSLSIDYPFRWRKSEEQDSLASFFRAEYQRNRTRERQIGQTIVGPQKDDFTVKLNQKDSRVFCSEGEQRTCATVLRFAEWERMRDRIEERPLFLVDDFGISFDSLRREKFTQLLGAKGQVFVTATESVPGLQGKEISSLQLFQKKQ